MYQDYTAAEAESKKEYEDMIEAENTALEEAFEKSNPIAPPELKPTEDEYERNAEASDRPDYALVDDFDDDNDEEVAPIVGEIIVHSEQTGGEI